MCWSSAGMNQCCLLRWGRYAYLHQLRIWPAAYCVNIQMCAYVQLNIQDPDRWIGLQQPALGIGDILLEMPGQKSEMKNLFLKSSRKICSMILSSSASSEILLINVSNKITSILQTSWSFLACKVFQMNQLYFRIFRINHWPFLCLTYMWPGALAPFADKMKWPFKISQVRKYCLTHGFNYFLKASISLCWPDAEQNHFCKVPRMCSESTS